MKTKYSQLLKVRKQKVDEVENKIAILNGQKRAIESEVDDILRQVEALKPPKEGKYREFLSISFSFGKLISLKKVKEELLCQKNQEIKDAKQEYKLALMEYEKIKYLDNLVIEEKLEKIRKDEQKTLDEMSVITYKRRTF